MAPTIAEAALGVVMSELFKVVKVAAKKTLHFKSNLKTLEKTLETVTLIFVEIKKLHQILDRPKQETDHFLDLLLSGLDLVQKCNTINSWNLQKRYSHSQKLVDLDESILKFFQINVQGSVAVNTLKTLIGVDQNGAKLDQNGAKLDKVLDYLIDNRSTQKNTKTEIRGDPNKFKFDLILKYVSKNEFLRLGSVPGVPNGVVGFDQPLKELKAMLQEPEVRIKVISAPPGCGKTTLAKMLCNDPEIQSIYKENIVFVNISESADTADIVKKVLQQRLPNSHQLPDIQNDDDDDAINHLESLLKFVSPSPILLVLDDAFSNWVSLLVSLLSLTLTNYKILMTSRYTIPEFKHVYSLKILNHQDAMTLFRQCAFPNDGSSTIIPHDLVRKTVEGCKGVPLTLTVVGRSLYGKEEVQWRSLHNNWSTDGKSFIDPIDSMLDCLHYSFLKDCYQDLGSFPEDQKVSATTLMDIWAELYNMDSIDTHSNLVELAFRKFLTLSGTRQTGNEVDGFGSEMSVMQDDMFRYLSIYLSNKEPIEHRKRLFIEIKGNNFPKWWTEEMNQPYHARLLSISTAKNFSARWLPLTLPAAEVVILNCSSDVYTIPEFIKRMKQLKVLVVTNYGSSFSKLLNFQLLGSLYHLRRMRLERISISSLDTSLLELVNLQKITFTKCKIEKAFENGNIDLSHIFPNLVEIEIDCCDDLLNLHVGLCDIVSLKKIIITTCSELSAVPEEIGRLRNLEYLMLNSCTNLFELPESIGDLHKLEVLDISDCLNMRKLPKRVSELHALKTIHVRGCRVLQDLYKFHHLLKI